MVAGSGMVVVLAGGQMSSELQAIWLELRRSHGSGRQRSGEVVKDRGVETLWNDEGSFSPLKERLMSKTFF